MPTAAEPRPAELPLPGGREGATVRLHPLLTGTCRGPSAWFLREEGRLAGLRALGFGTSRDGWARIPVPAFLVEHPSAGPLLVDTGFHVSVSVAPQESLGRLGTFTFRDVEMAAGQEVPAQLRERGIDPASVRTVVMTHLHLDHASGMSEFPDATFVFSAREWQAATEQGQLHGYVRHQFDHAFDYRTIDFDAPGVGSYATFGRSVDLFGDGSVRLVSTPGHTHGHLSVVLRLPDRLALLCGDAAYTLRTIEAGHPPARMEDAHRFRRSLREMQLFLRQHPDAVVVPGHDMDAWERLEPRYG